MKYLTLLAALALAGCGASGAPIKPVADTGLTIGGTITAGVARSGS